MKFKLLFLLSFFKLNFVFSQTINFETYKGIECEGSVPQYFLENLETQLGKDKLKIDLSKDEEVQKKALNLISDNSNYLHSSFTYGKVMFGDELTRYVGKIVKHILESNSSLPKDFQFYCKRQSDVNAVCHLNGVIFVNVGLIAHVNDEAELAFILCHEISHFQKQHSLNSVYEDYEVEKTERENRRVKDYYQTKTDNRFLKDRKAELEADSLGLFLFSNTMYAKNSALTVFDVLHNANYGYENQKLTPDFFNIEQLALPKRFFMDSVSKSKITEDINERYYTHPNTKNRKEILAKLATTLKFKGTQTFIAVKEPEFNYLRNLARFENIKLQLMYGDYGDVIYNAFCLLKKYPNNLFLNMSIAKAYYGLVKYKNADEFKSVAKRYTDVEGEAQQIHYVLKQFDKKQLNTYALKYVISLQKKYPKESALDTIKADLIKELVVVNELKASSFVNEIEPQNKEKEFYKTFLVDDIKNKELVDVFEKNYPLLEKRKKESSQSTAEKEKQTKERQKEIEKNGPKILAKDIAIMINKPIASVLNKKEDIDYLETEKFNSEVVTALFSASAEAGINCKLLVDTPAIKFTDKVYNDLVEINACIKQKIIHSTVEIKNTPSEKIIDYVNTTKSKYIYFVDCDYNQKYRKYNFKTYLFNLLTQKIVYTNYFDYKGSLKAANLKNSIELDLKYINK